jgi:hypothetical protein
MAQGGSKKPETGSPEPASGGRPHRTAEPAPDDLLTLQLEAPGGQTVELQLPRCDVLRLGWALVAQADTDPPSGNLFAVAPLMSIVNPLIAVRKADHGQVVLALKGKGWRPLLFQLDESALRELRDALDDVC